MSQAKQTNKKNQNKIPEFESMIFFLDTTQVAFKHKCLTP